MKLHSLILLFFILISPVWSFDVIESKTIEEFKILGPIPFNLKKKDIMEYLDFPFLNEEKICDLTEDIIKKGEDEYTWKNLKIKRVKVNESSFFYLTTWLKSDIWQRAEFFFTANCGVAAIYLDGKKKKLSQIKNGIKSSLQLSNGEHFLMIKVLVKYPQTFIFKAWMDYQESSVDFYLDKKGLINIDDVIQQSRCKTLALNKDYLLYSTYVKKRKFKEKKLYIRRIKDQKNIYSRNIKDERGFKWRNSQEFSFIRKVDNQDFLYSYNILNFEEKVLLRLNNIQDYIWDSKGNYIIYSTPKIMEDYEKKNRLIDTLWKRYNWQIKYNLYKYYPQSTSMELLKEDISLLDFKINKKGDKLLYVNLCEKSTVPPFFFYDIVLMDLNNLKQKRILQTPYWDKIDFFKDNIVLSGGREMIYDFKNQYICTLENNFDNQLYLYNIKSQKIECLTKDLKYSVEDFICDSLLDTIYIKFLDRDKNILCSFSLKDRIFHKINTGCDIYTKFDYYNNSIFLWGESSNNPPAIHYINLNKKELIVKKKSKESNRLIPDLKEYNVNYKNKYTIHGRLYYPLNYKKKNKYPCIVYFYGGATPVKRNYLGLYPFNWFASQGYFVYVIQLGGACGYGKDFSLKHQYDWGENRIDEIIYCVKQLLKDNNVVDKNNIGVLAASYGGMIAQGLAQYGSIFKTVISHGGISSIPDYWSDGKWGLQYCAWAAKDLYPWDKQDFIRLSPFYNVKKISVPLLLIHGEDDVNVNLSQSVKLFTALKVLNKKVYLLIFRDEKHHIKSYQGKELWLKSIIAWFDLYLKERPYHWDNLYKKSQ